MLDFLFDRRFNLFDMIWFSFATALLALKMIDLAGLALICLACAVFSAYVEGRK